MSFQTIYSINYGLSEETFTPVYTLPDPYDHDINLNSLKTRVAQYFVIILQNLIKAND